MASVQPIEAAMEAHVPPAKGPEEDCSVRVAVHIRPLIDAELVEGCQTCLSVSPGQSQVIYQ